MGRNKPFRDGAMNEWPAHEVTISFNFLVGSCQVKQQEFSELMGFNPSKFIDDNRPVDSVTFAEAQTFCEKLTNQMKNDGTLPKFHKVSLPGEALWEYVASLNKEFPEKRREFKTYAWYEDNSNDKTHKVGELAPFPDEVFDLLGNVLEWCLDSEAPDYRESPSSETPCLFTGYESKKALRGGSWADPLKLCHKTSRQCGSVMLRNNEVGLRCFIVPESFEAESFTPPKQTDANDPGCLDEMF